MDGVRGTVASVDGTPIGTLTGGAGPPLLLVHGGLSGLSRWAPLWQRLVTRFEVTALDRRGRGSSGDTPPYDIEREYEDVASVVAELAQRNGRPVDVFGHSFGAICALGAARTEAPIGRLALYDPPGPQAAPASWRERIGRLLAAGLPGPAVASFLIDVIGMTPPQVMALRDRKSATGVLETAARTLAREAAALAALDLEALTRDLAHPVLLLLGGESPPWAGQVTAVLRDQLPDAEQVTIRGHAHEGVDSAAATVAMELIRFLTPALASEG